MMQTCTKCYTVQVFFLLENIHLTSENPNTKKSKDVCHEIKLRNTNKRIETV